MHVIVIGGGFGGVRTARLLARDRKTKVTLISDTADFTHYAALASLVTPDEAPEWTISLGRVFADYPNVTLVHDTIKHIDFRRKTIRGKKEYGYDELVVAVGSVAHAEPSRLGYNVASVAGLERFMHYIEDEVSADKLLDKNFVVVGAGATGVELTGALAMYTRDLISRNEIKNTKVTISIIEASPTVLPRFSATAQKKVLARLRKIGVTVILNQRVESVNKQEVKVDGKVIPTHSVLWTAGSGRHPLFAEHEEIFTFSSSGHVVVDSHLSAAPHVYALGDSISAKYGGQASTALHQATFVAKLLTAKAHKRKSPTYSPVKYPFSVGIDPLWSYVETRNIYISGQFGSLSQYLLDFQILVLAIGWQNARSMVQLYAHQND